MSNTFDKLSVLDSFIEEVNSYLPEIETNLERLAQSSADMDALEETYRRTHTIGGSASMMDFPGLAHVAHGMEDILGDALDGLVTLDEPTLQLLQRSLGRLHQLLEGIRSGIDEDAVIAEDDSDYARYRALLDAPTVPPSQVSEDYRSAGMNGHNQILPSSPSLSPSSGSLPPQPPSSVPSFDEVLASFRTPSLAPGDDLGWPEEPALVSRFDEALSSASTPAQLYQAPAPDAVPPTPVYPDMENAHPSSSALDALVASTRRTPLPESTPYEYDSGTPVAHEPVALSPFAPDVADAQLAVTPNMPALSSAALPQVYTSMQQNAEAVANQVVTLKNLVEQLREAFVVVETQRSEFKGFLDGSKDALDRMEIWAGKAMGLNLRNSPEQVRRYLPLSVMWVSNSKLKKVMDLLKKITDGVEMTDEQMYGSIQQLQVSLQSYSDLFQQAQDHLSEQAAVPPVWTPWEMQVSHDADHLRERVTFERQGDPDVLRAEIEAQMRGQFQREREQLLREFDDHRREYESRNTQAVDRVILEQQIRNEIRQEYAERQRLEERVRNSSGRDEEALHALEARIRGDIEIQVRQEFLSNLNLAAVQGDIFARPEAPAPGITSSVVTPSNKVVASMPANATPVQQKAAPAPPVAPTRPSSAPSFDVDEEAVEVFRLEAEELLQTISMNVAVLEKNPTNLEYIQGVRRATHTLKGAAGMMGLRAIADLAHVSEDLLDLIMEGAVPISTTVVSLILDTAEALDLLIMGNDLATGEARSRELRSRYSEFLGEQGASAHVTDMDLDLEEEHDTPVPLVGENPPVENTVEATLSARGNHGNLNVHVRLQKLDELVNLFGEMLVSRSVLEERIQRLVRLVADVAVSSNRLGDVGQKLESRFEAATLPSGRSVLAMPGEGDQSLAARANLNGPVPPVGSIGRNDIVPAHLSDFDELELDRYTEFHLLARGLSEGISDMATLSTEMDSIIRECEGVFARESRLSTAFQDRLMKVRLVPLTTMSPRLYRAARAVALKQGKEIDLVMEGESTEVDRTVYEEIFGPLLHLVRNAVNHAIETPDVRRRQGKSPNGLVKISASYDGNQIVISVNDDGRGLDREHIRQTAITRGLIRPDHQIGEDEVVALIFRPGFSTAEKLSEESGRGVGLDVVRDSVSRLRGNLVVESTPNQGTTFTMTFPTSLAIQSAMMVRAGGQQFAVPTVNVESIGRLDNFKRVSQGGQPVILVRNEPYPLQFLAQYLSLPVNTNVDDKAQILLINSGGHRVALMVDEIKGKFDIVMKNLGPHLRDVEGIAGGTVLGNGQVVLVLELSALLSSYVNRTSMFPIRRDVVPGPVRQRVEVAINRQSVPVQPAQAPAPERGKHVLVVDDSPSVRRVVSNMLKQHGWAVQMARDGVEALEMISLETPAAVLLDIEMPRMDGYELISTVRAQEQYRTLPLVVLTSRAAAKHQQRAMTLGASAYVVKPYQDEELLNTISSLVFGATGR